MLTLVALRGEKWRDAEAYCRRALTLRPNAYYALNNLGLALFRQANALAPRVSLPRFTEAIDCLQRAIALNPTERLARENLSATLSRYLLTYPLFVLCAFTIGLLFRVGGPDTTLMWVVVFPAVAMAYCVILGVLRYRALPPDVQAWWRRERLQRWRGRRVR
jgi:tetratricopeptide (TPR) repeat protein